MRPAQLIGIGGATLLAVVLILALGPKGSSTDAAHGGPGAEASGTGSSGPGTPGSGPSLPWPTGLPPTDKVALLVGIDGYQEGVPGLRGCVRDVQRARDLLIQRFGFKPGDVLVLTDQQATHENIVRAYYEWLIARSQPDTEALFWFSGHGSQVPDTGEELEKQDSTFLAWDSRAGEHSQEDRRGEYDVTDDEFRSLLAALTDVTSRVTIVTDSCHSGGGMRGAGDVEAPRPRSVPAGVTGLDWDLVKGFWPADVPLDRGNGIEVDGSRYVHLAACAKEQLAYEHTYEEDGRKLHQGALSFFLIESLRGCSPQVTWEQLAEVTRSQVTTQYWGQSPWPEGALQRQVFGADFSEPLSGIPGAVQRDRVHLEAGTLHRLREGSRLAVYDPLADSGSAPLGTIEIDRADTLSSRAHWVADEVPGILLGPDGEPRDGTPIRAVEIERPPGSDPLFVFVTDGDLADALDGEFGELAEDSGEADLILRRDDEGGIALLTPEGLRLRRWKSDQAGPIADDLSQVLQEEARWRAFLALPGEPGSVRMRVGFRDASPGECERFRYRRPQSGIGLVDGRNGREYRAEGGPHRKDYRLAMLTVENTEPEAYHVVVMSVSEDHHASEVLWPYEGMAGEDNVLEPGQELPVPVGFVVTDEWTLERPMRDRYIVVATRDYANFRPHMRPIPDPEVLRSGAQPDTGPTTALPGPIQAAVVTLRGGLGNQKVTGAGWGVSSVDVLVRRVKE